MKNTSAQSKANLGSFRLAAAGLETPPVERTLAAGLVAALRHLESQRSGEEARLLDDHFRATWDGWTQRREDLAKVRKEFDQLNGEIPTTLVLAKVDQPRETFFRIRGGYLTKGDKVDVGVPPVWNKPDPNIPLDRLGFARWLVSTNNPLTARVQVNRYWEQLFGRGIVETTEEFGKQGEPPSNPDLLDWLATEFMQPTVTFSRTGAEAARPWDIKRLLKVMVMSATYRQSSKPTPELLDRDPFNRLLARGPRVRLEAEMLRDQALAASGLLSDKIGGPSVMPRQPDGIWQVVYSGDQWNTSAGEDQYRRSLYTFWRRSSPPPMMVNFDAPSREFCVLKRNRSNTPLQALNLLNDPACLEFAQALARRVVCEGGASLDARIDFAFQACVARLPKDAERSRLKALFEGELARFRDNPSAAEKMATHPLGPPAPGQDLSELAAWTVVANVLLNLDEMVTKG
jgi:hypothetical protein